MVMRDINVGDICISVFEYYDELNNKMSYKARPVLVIGKPDSDDYTILPISTVSKRKYVNKKYDIFIDSILHEELGLNKDCYIRTNKQSYVHRKLITKIVSSLKTHDPAMFYDALMRTRSYNTRIISDGLNF